MRKSGYISRASAVLDMAFICLSLQLILVYVNSAWYKGLYNRYSQNAEYTNLSTALLLLGFLLIFLLILIRLLRNVIQFDRAILLNIAFLICFGCFWCMHTALTDIAKKILTEHSAPSVLLMVAVVLLYPDDRQWRSLLSVFYGMGLFFALLSFVETAHFISRFGFIGRISFSPVMQYFTLSLYCLWVVVSFDEKHSGAWTCGLLCAAALLICVAVVMQGRSWVLQTALLFCVAYSRNMMSVKKRMAGLIFLITMVIVFAVVLYDYTTQATESLFIRTFESSRSEQLSSFFRQVSSWDLLKGQGISATYRWSGYGDYHYIDNQFILLMFRYGVIPMVLYALLFLRPIFFSLKKCNRAFRLKVIAAVMWVMGGLGLSIYLNYDLNLINLIILIYIGRLHREIDETTRVKTMAVG